MHPGKIKIANASGESSLVDYFFADDGKVLVDKDGNSVSYIEAEKITEFSEVEFSPDDETDAFDKAEAYDILTGVSE